MSSRTGLHACACSTDGPIGLANWCAKSTPREMKTEAGSAFPRRHQACRARVATVLAVPRNARPFAWVELHRRLSVLRGRHHHSNPAFCMPDIAGLHDGERILKPGEETEDTGCNTDRRPLPALESAGENRVDAERDAVEPGIRWRAGRAAFHGDQRHSD